LWKLCIPKNRKEKSQRASSSLDFIKVKGFYQSSRILSKLMDSKDLFKKDEFIPQTVSSKLISIFYTIIRKEERK
jgi:hypothetical protein